MTWFSDAQNRLRGAAPTLIAVASCSLLVALMAHAPARRSIVAIATARGARPSQAPRGFDPSLPIPSVGVAELRAGERVTFRWRSIERRAEELELVFSVDDGRTYDLRVSPELSAGESRFEWQVPNVDVARAHVRLRARIDGHEMSGYPSAPFRIVPNPRAPRGRWSFRDGEWWEDARGKVFDIPGRLARGAAFRTSGEHASPAATSRLAFADRPTRSSAVSVIPTPAPRAGELQCERALLAFRPTRE